MMRIVNMIVVAGWLAASVCVAGPDGTDWPRWRGPNGDGISPETAWRTEAVAEGPKILWQAEAGNGYSAVSVRGQHAVTMGNVDNQDIVYCVDAATGKEFWRHTYACKRAGYPGPRATPAIDGDRVYTFSRAGHVFCLNAKTGAVKWQRNVAKELKAKAPRWGFAGSPVIAGNALLINAGPHGMALDKLTGSTLWDSGAGTGGYSTPVSTRIAGKPTVLLFGKTALLAVDPVNGDPCWSIEWETKHSINAADPVVMGNEVWISSGYERGCALVDCGGPTPNIVWENKAISAQFSSGVLLDGYIYGMDGNVNKKGQLVCLKPDTGATVWSQELGFGSLILAGKRLIVLNEKGSLYIVAASPDGYRQLAAAEDLMPATCWTAPTLSQGLLYLRNDKGKILCLDLN